MKRLRSLREIVGDYVINVHGLNVDVPYWINWDALPYFKDAPYRGKGRPAQIALAANRAYERAGQPPATASELRIMLKRHGLGIDCSGFVYRVLDVYLRQYRQRLASHLVVLDSEIQEMMRRHSEIGVMTERTSLPKHLPLAAVATLWHKDPATLTQVQRLTHPRAAAKVPTASDVRAGDLIRMTSSNGDHIALVLSADSKTIEYVAAEDEENGLGGVRYHTINVDNPARSLEYQSWRQRIIFDNERDGVWRLRVLEGLFG